MSGFPARSYVYVLFLFFLRRYQKTSLDSLRAAPTHLRRAGKDTCVSWLSLQEERGQDSDLGEENMTMAWAKGKVIRPSCFKGLKEKIWPTPWRIPERQRMLVVGLLGNWLQDNSDWASWASSPGGCGRVCAPDRGLREGALLAWGGASQGSRPSSCLPCPVPSAARASAPLAVAAGHGALQAPRAAGLGLNTSHTPALDRLRDHMEGSRC